MRHRCSLWTLNGVHFENLQHDHHRNSDAIHVKTTGNFQLDHHRLASLEAKLSTEPKILSKTAGSCSIFKVPQNFIDVNDKYYHPHLVSVGPFHHNKPHLQMIQEHKYTYLSQLLTRTHLTLTSLFDTISPLEIPARECYSESIPLDSHEFIEIMVVDGCFILELFRKVSSSSPVDFEPDDPLASVSWILPCILRDLLRLENQLPFFILQRLFYQTRSEPNQPICQLTDLCFKFFGYEQAVERPRWVVERMQGFEARHLLHLLMTSFIPPVKLKSNGSQSMSMKMRKLESKRKGNRDIKGNRESAHAHLIHCVSKLRRAGIQIRPPTRGSKTAEAETFLEVKWNPSGVIEMPTITIDDFMTSFLANCVAYECCQKSFSMHFTTYTTLLDCLVNTSKDVEYLCDHNIIENYLGTDTEVATYLNNLGKDMAFDIDRCYLIKLFNQVNEYYESDWHLHWASFKYTYFRTPWSFISALAALVLLVASILQAVYTVSSSYHPR